MDPTAQTCKPRMDRIEPPPPEAFWQRPAVRTTLGSLHIVSGVLVAAAAFVVIGLWAALLGCVGGETAGLCASASWLVPVLGRSSSPPC